MSQTPPICIEMFPAKAGDSFLVNVDKKHILIDCGFTDTYKDFIKPRLQALAEQNEELALLVITHIDEDHIQGALKLLEENVNADEHQIIPIRQIWHNAFRHLPIVRQKSVLSETDVNKLKRVNKKGIEIIGEKKQNISAKQGTTFGKDILKGNYAWNSDFDGKAVATHHKTEVQLTPSVKLILLSPTEEKLEKLANFWRLQSRKWKLPITITEDTLFDDAFELLLREMPDLQPPIGRKTSNHKPNIDGLMLNDIKEDASPPNGSSIAFVVEFNGKRLLFLADAHPSIIVQDLERIFPDEPFPIQFDFIKVAHHGSFYNNKSFLWQKIDAEIYAISTDGEDNEHPSPETLAWIVGRPTTCKCRKRHLYFNYPNQTALRFDNAELKSKFKYEIYLTEKNNSTIITI